jgi:hypothetical protein
VQAATTNDLASHPNVTADGDDAVPLCGALFGTDVYAQFLLSREEGYKNKEQMIYILVTESESAEKSTGFSIILHRVASRLIDTHCNGPRRGDRQRTSCVRRATGCLLPAILELRRNADPCC